MSKDPNDMVILEEDLVPDPEPNAVPTAILEEDEDAAPRGMGLQTIAFFIGVLVIILLVILLASGGTLNLFNVGGSAANVNPRAGSLQPQLSGQTGGQSLTAGGQAGVDALGSIPDFVAQIDPLFRSYWQTYGGVEVFGKPISGMLEENGRKFQWFERSRLEYWPEHEGTRHEIQPGRLGVEYTKNRQFPTQEYFVNRPGLQYEEVTQHGIRGAFLDYWLKHGGVDIFGYPISDELQEILPEDNAYHTVQYFERARFELHPGAAQPVMLGRLGDGLHKQGSEPNIIDPVKPTPVPITP
ncbi:MAG TPA: hypothetical protein VGE07_21150 [Herpetosiphonaceae bacterium]